MINKRRQFAALFPLVVSCLSIAFVVGDAEAATLQFNAIANDGSDNAATRAAWLSVLGVASPANRIDFEVGFSDNQNVHAVSGLFPDGLVIRDSDAGEAIICCDIGEDVAGAEPDGEFAVTQNERPFMELDFTASPVDYVSFHDIDHTAGTTGIVSFVGGGTEAFSLDFTSGDGGEFFAFFRNDMPAIIRVEFDASGDGRWGLDNIEYGLLFPRPVLSVSPDISIDLGASGVGADEDVIVDNQLGIVVLENLGAIPDSSDLIAFGLDVNGDRLMAFASTTELTGSVIARRGDVVRYDGTNYSIEFDASFAGVPSSTATDAVSLSPNGLLLSFDTTVVLPGDLVVADEDLVEWNGTAFSLLLDGSSQGLNTALDIDGAQSLGGGQFLVSFDTAGAIGGFAFADEDVLRFDGTSWSLDVDSSTLGAAWAAADLDAMIVPEPTLGWMIAAGSLGLAILRRRGTQG